MLDPSGGPGWPLIAGKKTARQARLIELDRRYCDVIIRCRQEFGGSAATLERAAGASKR